MIGEIGTTQTDLGPEGRVFVHGEIWNARASVPISKGQRVVVRRMTEDMVLDVEPVGAPERAHAEPALP